MDNVYVDRSVIMDGCRIEPFTHIIGSIVGRKVIIESSHERPTYIEDNPVIGTAVKVREGCRLTRTRINPGLVIPKGMTYIDKFLQTYEDIIQLSQ